MRKLLLLFLLLPGFISCSENDTPEAVIPEFKITGEAIAIDKPLHAVDDSIMLSIGYSVFPADIDENIIISCNNREPYSLKTESFDEERLVTAWLPPAGKIGENEIRIVISSEGKEYEFTKTFRVIKNNDLENWWPALSYETLENSFPLRFEIGNAISMPLAPNGEYNILNIGSASKQFKIGDELYKKRTLINGIYGRYHPEYDADKKLEKIKVHSGNTAVDIRISFTGVLDDISASYGQPEEVVDDTYALFTPDEYSIIVTRNNADIYTEITRK